MRSVNEMFSYMPLINKLSLVILDIAILKILLRFFNVIMLIYFKLWEILFFSNLICNINVKVGEYIIFRKGEFN